MTESYLVSRDESLLEYSSSGDELKDSKYHVESIVLEDDDESSGSSPLAEI
jgi:hypothetical protein